MPKMRTPPSIPIEHSPSAPQSSGDRVCEWFERDDLSAFKMAVIKINIYVYQKDVEESFINTIWLEAYHSYIEHLSELQALNGLTQHTDFWWVLVCAWRNRTLNVNWIYFIIVRHKQYTVEWSIHFTGTRKKSPITVRIDGRTHDWVVEQSIQIQLIELTFKVQHLNWMHRVHNVLNSNIQMYWDA